MRNEEERQDLTPPPSGSDPRVEEMAAEKPDQPSMRETDGVGVRERFDRVQSEFIDDPKGAVEHARTMVVEAVDRLMEEIRSELGDLNDTERMRVALRRYREVLDRITAG